MGSTHAVHYTVDINQKKKPEIVDILTLYKDNRQATALVIKAIAFYLLYAKVPPGSKADPNLFWTVSDIEPASLVPYLDGAELSQNGVYSAFTDECSSKLDQMIGMLHAQEYQLDRISEYEETIQSLEQAQKETNRNLREVMKRLRELESVSNQDLSSLESLIQDAIKSAPTEPSKQHKHEPHPVNSDVNVRAEDLQNDIMDIFDML